MCFEAFAILIGVPYSISKDITYETGEIARGRNVVRLTSPAVQALTAIYEDSKTTSTKGMTKREILHHIKRCDIREMPPQRIDQIMNKHAIIDEKDGIKVLPFEGFLDIYQSYACQSNANDVSVTPYCCATLISSHHTCICIFLYRFCGSFNFLASGQICPACRPKLDGSPMKTVTYTTTLRLR
jgi:hypothetical protein